jgi:hypothetical protein
MPKRNPALINSRFLLVNSRDPSRATLHASQSASIQAEAA